MTTAPTRKKDPFYLTIKGNSVVRLQLVASAFSAELLTALGIQKGATNGDVPDGKTLIGSGRNAAILNGCFPVNLVYDVGAGKTQTAKVLVAPANADTAVAAAKSAKYRGKQIIDVRPPRRRVYVS